MECRQRSELLSIDRACSRLLNEAQCIGDEIELKQCKAALTERREDTQCSVRDVDC